MDADDEPLPGGPGELERRRRPVLSDREVEVTSLIAEGLGNKEIAARLEISTYTVASYLRRIFAKLDVSTRAQMVARAKDRGLLGGQQG